MRWQTHVAADMAAAGAICQIAGPTSIRCCTLILGTVFGSLLPDIDCSKSKIATSTATSSCVSVLLEDSLGHRGIIHTPFIAFLLSGVLLY